MNQWKMCWVVGVVALAGLAVGKETSAEARAVVGAQQVEIGVQAVFTPPKGWDNNDRIQAVVYGELPDGCYSIGETDVQDLGNNSFWIRQYAIKNPSDGCVHPSTLPPHALVPITFTQVVGIGVLPVGDYKLFYSQVVSGPVSRVFSVAQAGTSSVDNVPYADVLQQYADDVLDVGQDLVVTMKGVLNSTCERLSLKDVKILREGDVIVLLPEPEYLIAEDICAPIMLPFEIKVNLGAQKQGLLLVHVRSKNGNAINHVVKVIQ